MKKKKYSIDLNQNSLFVLNGDELIPNPSLLKEEPNEKKIVEIIHEAFSEKTDFNLEKNVEIFPESKIELNGYGKFNQKIDKPSNYKAENYLETANPKDRIEKNINALELSLKIIQEGRYATKEEQKTLASFSGWGGLSGVFGGNDSFSKENARLKDYFEKSSNNTEEATKAYASALKSSSSAYYTNPMIIEAIYDGLNHLGLKENGIQKEVLEPSLGVGNFLSHCKNNDFNFSGVELEKDTFNIAKALYPNSNLYFGSFESFNNKDYYDVVVGNPPYDNTLTINDSCSFGDGQKIVNYFPIKAMESMREGGILAFVMPTGFLDNNSNNHLYRLMQVGANFIGAVRLNDSVFKHSGTSINTDIVFFQKGKALNINTLKESERENGLNLQDKYEEILKENSLNIVTNNFVSTQAEEIYRENAMVIEKQEFVESFKISNYFALNPQNILGKMELEKNQFGEYKAVVKDDGRDLKTALNLFIKSLPENIYKEQIREEEKEVREFDFISNPKDKDYIYSLKNGNYFLNFLSNPESLAVKISNTHYKTIDFRNLWEESLSESARKKVAANLYPNDKRIKEIEAMKRNLNDYIMLRDNLNILLSEELKEENTDKDLLPLREKLNKIFDDIKFKNSNKDLGQIFKGFKDELSFEIIKALEEKEKKSEIFFKRVQSPLSIPKPTTAKEAYIASLSLYGKINIDYLKEALNQPLRKTLDEMLEQKLIFKDHTTGNYIQGDLYLSGNVKAKYKEVEKLIEQGRDDLIPNLNSLKSVFPKDKTISEIHFGFGMKWIPVNVYESFVNHYLSLKPFYFEAKKNNQSANIVLMENSYKLFTNETKNYSDRWQSNKFYKMLLSKGGIYYSYDAVRKNYATKEEFENDRKMCLGLAALEYALNRETKVIERWNGSYKLDKNGKPTYKKEMITHLELTKDINFAIKDIERSFVEYALGNKEIRNIIINSYNNIINTDAPRNYDGNNLILHGMNPNIKLRKHQSDGIWRGIGQKATLFNYQVGAGKTMVGAALAIEQKRMGLINKAVIVVPKHLIASWQKEFKNLYPNANVLALDENSLKPKNRKNFLAKIKLNNYDAIIMTKEQFKNIPKNPSAKITKYLEIIETKENELAKINDGSKSERGKKRNQIKNSIKKIEDKIREIEKISENKNDNILSFEELGIDCLVVDEAHLFKNLYYETRKEKVLGLGSKEGSQLALDMSLVTDNFHKDGKKIYFLTGTPIANSLCEVYHMQRYLQPKWLSEKKFYNFDDWANTFGEDVTDYELGAGGEPKLVTRFSRFNNIENLVNGFKEVNDYVNADDIIKASGNLIPKGKVIKVIAKRSPEVEKFYGIPDEKGKYPRDSLLYRFDNFLDDPIENHPLKLTNLARKAALDYRAIDNREEFDFKDSKINLLVKNIIDNYHNNHAEEKGTQIVFCDLSVAKTPLKDIDIDTPNKDFTENKTPLIEFTISYLDGDVESFNNIDEYKEAILAKGVEISQNTILKNVEELENGKFSFVSNASLENTGSKIDNEALEGMSFDAYADIAKKLLKSGIPKEEIAFIHDYKNTKQKEELFKKVNSGEIRILIGSTSRMGTGMNVQERLVALHNLDYPWNPAGFEQRIGRIERQGNIFFNKDKSFQPIIYNYGTEKTYDVKALQILETKQNSFNRFYLADRLGLNECEDLMEGSINFSEMKALTSGNPLLMEEYKINSELEKQEYAYKMWIYNKSSIKDDIDDKVAEKEKCLQNLNLIESISNSNNRYDEQFYTKYGHLKKANEVVVFNIRGEKREIGWCDDFGREKKENAKKLADSEFKEIFKIAFKINRTKALLSYKGVIVTFQAKIEDTSFVQLALYPDNIQGSAYREFENGIELKNLRIDKGFVLNSSQFGLDFITNRVSNFLQTMDKEKTNLKNNIESLNKSIKENQELLESIPAVYPKQALLEALRKDKQIIPKKIANKDFSWQPSYKNINKNEVKTKWVCQTLDL